MRILFALPGFHVFDRGAEIALLSVARELAHMRHDVTVVGAGPPRATAPYRYISAPAVRRTRFERFPRLPALLRSETAYEELTFSPGLWARYRPGHFDITATCSYPFTNWILRRPAMGRRPKHVFVTQNGDWAAYSNDAEYRLFGCDGLICTNPDYFDRNRSRWRCSLIPNGIDLERFSPGPSEPSKFDLPVHKRIVLMVSALIPSKRVLDGVHSVAEIEDAVLVVAGDGPLRDEVQNAAELVMPGRYHRLEVSPADMPSLYRSADAFLHMSLEESFGNVFLEAMACGIPIVAQDSDRVRWIVGDDQHLTDTRSSSATASALRAAINAASRPPADNMDRFAWPNVARQYSAFFETIA